MSLAACPAGALPSPSSAAGERDSRAISGNGPAQVGSGVCAPRARTHHKSSPSNAARLPLLSRSLHMPARPVATVQQRVDKLESYLAWRRRVSERAAASVSREQDLPSESLLRIRSICGSRRKCFQRVVPTHRRLSSTNQAASSGRGGPRMSCNSLHGGPGKGPPKPAPIAGPIGPAISPLCVRGSA